jgi:hypothetical protein
VIRYRLECGKGHQFEAWFASGAAYDRQEAGGQLECPHCASREVRKALMAPNVTTRKGRSEPAAPRDETAATDAAPAVPTALLSDTPEAAALRQVHAVLKAVRDKVRAEADYVGPRFAEEARRIHDEEAPVRGIYGEATREEVADLIEDGIDVTPLPRLPDDLT